MAANGPVPVFGVAADVGFVDLDDVGVDPLELAAQHARDGHGEMAVAGVMLIGEHLGQHVRAGTGELERMRGQCASELVIARKVERALADLARDHAGRLGAIGQARVRAEFVKIADGKTRGDAVHAADEIIDHAVGFGMAGVEAVELAVGDDVDAGQFLGFEHNHDGVAQGDARAVAQKPVRHGVAADDSSPDGHHVHSILRLALRRFPPALRPARRG